MRLTLENGVLTLFLEVRGEKGLFTECGVDLFKTANQVIDPPNGGYVLVFESQVIIFNLLAFMFLTRMDRVFSRAHCVRNMLFIYESLTKEESNQCNLFLVSLLEKFKIKPEENKSALVTLLSYEYNQAPSPLVAVIDDELDENQTLFLVDRLAHQRGWHNAEKNINLAAHANPYSPLKYSPLIHACERGSSELVRLMIEKSPNQVNLRYLLNNQEVSEITDAYLEEYRIKITAIHAAAARGDVHVLQVLLDHSASVALRNSLGETPLHVAKNAACVDLLVKYGADVNAVDHAGATALHAACYSRFYPEGAASNPEVLREVSDNNREKISSLIKAGASLNQQDKNGNTPLHCAVNVFFKEPFRNTRYALSVIALLCEGGANPNVCNKASNINDAVPPLLYLYEDRRYSQVEGYDEFKLYYNQTGQPFFEGVRGALMIADLLLQYGADSTARSSKGYTILHFLANINDSVGIKYFLDFPAVKALVNDQQSKARVTPLHFAVGSESPSFLMTTLDLLLAHGADLSLTCYDEENRLTVFELGRKRSAVFNDWCGRNIMAGVRHLEKAYIASTIKMLKAKLEPADEAQHMDLVDQIERLLEFTSRVCGEDKNSNHFMAELQLLIAAYQMSQITAMADVPVVVKSIQTAEKFASPNEVESIKRFYFELANRCLNLQLESKPFRLAMAIGFLKKAGVDYTRFMAELMGLEMSADVGSMEALQKNYPIAYHHATRLINNGPTTCVDPQGVYIVPQSNQHFFWHQPLLKAGQPQIQADSAVKAHHP